MSFAQNEFYLASADSSNAYLCAAILDCHDSLLRTVSKREDLPFWGQNAFRLSNPAGFSFHEPIWAYMMGLANKTKSALDNSSNQMSINFNAQVDASEHKLVVMESSLNDQQFGNRTKLFVYETVDYFGFKTFDETRDDIEPSTVWVPKGRDEMLKEEIALSTFVNDNNFKGLDI